MDTINLQDPNLYINREISMIRFNERVLAQVYDDRIPLLERLRFLFICNQNMDEFFEVRMAVLKQKIELGAHKETIDGYEPEALLMELCEKAREVANEQYTLLNSVLFPALEKENIRFVPRKQWTEKQAVWIKRYFRKEVLPVLTPIGLDVAHPFPRLVNKNLNFVVSLHGKDAFGRDSGLAIIHAPRALARIIRLPDSFSQAGDNFVFLSSIIHAHATDLFPGMSVTGCYQFRLTRNSQLLVDEEQTDDLLHALKGQLSSTRYGDIVRLEVADSCPDTICQFLLQKFQMQPYFMYRCAGPVNLSRLGIVIDLLNRPDLCYPSITPGYVQHIKSDNLFDRLQSEDILLHHPYQSFNQVEAFIYQAAQDANVVAIKMTLYRTWTPSGIIDSLVEAAKTGKEVTAIIELRARFDEADNIALANRLQEAGVLVVYGVIGHKTHAKMTLVVRRENKIIRRYVHLSTGNYHRIKAQQYSDFGLISSNAELARDVHYIFQQLTGMGRATKLKKIMHSPFTLHKFLLRLIEQESDCARQGKSAQIIAKLNALTEKTIIQALYCASQAGVKIDLIVRGACCLRPGIPNVSDNIHVRSIVGRYLEHARVYYFHNNEPCKIFLSSADWMDHSFFSRVEICFPLENEALAERLKKEGLMLFLADNSDSWLLQKDGLYKKLSRAANQSGKCAQQMLIDMLAK